MKKNNFVTILKDEQQKVKMSRIEVLYGLIDFDVLSCWNCFQNEINLHPTASFFFQSHVSDSVNH